MNLNSLKTRVNGALQRIREAESAREAVRDISQLATIARSEMPVLIEEASLDQWENERLRKEVLSLTVQVGILTRERDSLKRQLEKLDSFGEGITLDEIEAVESVTLPALTFAVGAD